MKRTSPKAWQGMIKKMKQKITNLGGVWLNPAGHLILIKSVLSSLPLYQFAVLQAPRYVLQQLGIFIRNFLWEGTKQTTRKYHMVNWKTVTSPRQHGGLGIRDPRLTNPAIGAKLWWGLVIKPEEWWAQVIRGKYFKQHE